MDKLSSTPEYLTTIVLTGIFLLLMLIEALFPLRQRKRSWIRRVIINGCMSAVAFVVGTFVVRNVSLGLIGWTSENQFGLLQFFELPLGVQFVAGFLLMDLTFYYWHRVNHVVPLLWRFHNVHHIDPDMDVSTSFRFHFVEIFYSTGFRVLQVGLIGIAPLTYVVYELVFQCATMFHHSNMRLPVQIERLLNKIFVTPRMHGIHHSAVMDETNSNYSVVFRWWDALHKSLILGVSQAKIDIGVPAYQEPEDNGLWALICLPFRKQREYWRYSDGTASARDSSDASARNVLVE
jgi:sterol desaturase/sphingolipid hydroxylase (fatty acid hydroxylase superfamily)